MGNVHRGLVDVIACPLEGRGSPDTLGGTLGNWPAWQVPESLGAEQNLALEPLKTTDTLSTCSFLLWWLLGCSWGNGSGSFIHG